MTSRLQIQDAAWGRRLSARIVNSLSQTRHSHSSASGTIAHTYDYRLRKTPSPTQSNTQITCPNQK